MTIDHVFSINSETSTFVRQKLYKGLIAYLGTYTPRMVFECEGEKKAHQGKKGNRTIHSILSVSNFGSESTKKQIQKSLEMSLGITVRYYNRQKQRKNQIPVTWHHNLREYIVLISEDTWIKRGGSLPKKDHPVTQRQVEDVFVGGSVRVAARNLVATARYA